MNPNSTPPEGLSGPLAPELAAKAARDVHAEKTAQAGVQGPDPRAVLLDTITTTLNRSGYWLPTEARTALADAIASLRNTRAEQAETQLAALKSISSGYCPECGRGDCSPTANQWYEQRQRADRHEATIERVRAELTSTAEAPLPVGYDNSEAAIREYARTLLAALDEQPAA